MHISDREVILKDPKVRHSAPMTLQNFKCSVALLRKLHERFCNISSRLTASVDTRMGYNGLWKILMRDWKFKLINLFKTLGANEKTTYTTTAPGPSGPEVQVMVHVWRAMATSRARSAFLLPSELHEPYLFNYGKYWVTSPIRQD